MIVRNKDARQSVLVPCIEIDDCVPDLLRSVDGFFG